MVNYQNLTCNLAWTKLRGSRTNFQPKKSYGPRIKSQEPCTNSLATRNSDLGPRTSDQGYCGRFSVSFGLYWRGGAAGRRGLRLGPAVYLSGWRREWDIISFWWDNFKTKILWLPRGLWKVCFMLEKAELKLIIDFALSVLQMWKTSVNCRLLSLCVMIIAKLMLSRWIDLVVSKFNSRRPRIWKML